MIKKKIYRDVKSFVVNRATWLRGKGSSESYLRDEFGNQCCLGFFTKQCGFTNSQIEGSTSPEELDPEYINIWETKLLNDEGQCIGAFCNNSVICNELMSVNDNARITDRMRESRLKKLFNKIGIIVKFIGKSGDEE